ncbi:SDR family oxidoreductase [Marinobacter nanhaiticus D15-8W]|uniref:SDR family oxidoreductase n=1 Tax=Marinobacter nanhaiticus D15-8W TaxID=626887 RepID=N6WPU9_9GAMM|nr:SDR family oxidoreductase [Marinobacter nanhaiticus]ENO13087.1 SDR family oxidoreductase [Marinobacter nanhaiticus D15-8W]BES70442.1 SDR family oxidoreductase [Marinobacter nanhaiticus D15-8W]
MHISLKGKTALLTGSTKGIGFAAAKGLAEAGAAVVVNGRTQEAVDKAVSSIRESVSGADVKGVAANAGTADGCNAIFDAVPDCDILVNNVGIFGPKDFFEITDDEWQQMFDINVMSGVRLARGYLPKMKDRGWGRVVFLSSESGLNMPPEMLHYGFSKTAVLGISRGLAKIMSATGVTVNSVLPGPTLSEGVASMLQDDVKERGVSLEEAGRDFVKAHRPSSILQRPATVEEVANMIIYACSEQASATTGAALRVDGGVVDSIA